jgi:hypothetical protein
MLDVTDFNRQQFRIFANQAIQTMKIKKAYLWIGLGAIIILIVILFRASGGGATKGLTAKVMRGPFQIVVTTTGELEAKNSEKIMGPEGLSQVGIWRTTIEDIIADGSLVDSGQYVGPARPDRNKH